DQEDAGLGGDGVGPLDVQGDFDGPTAVRPGQGAAAGLVHLGEGRVGQAVGEVELPQVAGDGRVVVGVHDGDRRAGAVARDRAVGEGDFVEPVGVADLRGGQPRGGGRRVRLQAPAVAGEETVIRVHQHGGYN